MVEKSRFFSVATLPVIYKLGSPTCKVKFENSVMDTHVEDISLRGHAITIIASEGL